MYFHRLQPDFEYVPESGNADLDYVKREEHERQIKDLERKMSALLAENLEIGEMVIFYFLPKYVNQINYLYVLLHRKKLLSMRSTA